VTDPPSDCVRRKPPKQSAHRTTAFCFLSPLAGQEACMYTNHQPAHLARSEQSAWLVRGWSAPAPCTVPRHYPTEAATAHQSLHSAPSPSFYIRTAVPNHPLHNTRAPSELTAVSTWPPVSRRRRPHRASLTHPSRSTIFQVHSTIDTPH